MSAVEEQAALAAKVKLTEAQTADVETTSQLKIKYGVWVRRFVVGYCGIVLALIVVSSWTAWCPWLDLSDTILGVLAGSTAAAAIGQISFVTRGLFSYKSGE